MVKKVDLHCHSNYSDGALSPIELLSKANNVNIDIISITDHDSVEGVKEAIEIEKKNNLRIIPGVELSAFMNHTEVHIIGYFIDINNEQLVSNLQIFKNDRIQRAERIVRKINKMNIPLRFESVLSHSGNGSISRPHIAAAMIKEGFIESYLEAFQRYIGNDCPAYEKKLAYSPQQIISIIHEAGGLSILAHPGNTLREEEIFQIIDAGIDGIEVIHPGHTPNMIRYYRKIVNEFFLLETGGSDFHGGLKNDDENLGQFTISHKAVESMEQRLFL